MIIGIKRNKNGSYMTTEVELGDDRNYYYVYSASGDLLESFSFEEDALEFLKQLNNRKGGK